MNTLDLSTSIQTSDYPSFQDLFYENGKFKLQGKSLIPPGKVGKFKVKQSTTDPLLMIACYIRVSTKHQVEDQTHESQRHKIAQAIYHVYKEEINRGIVKEGEDEEKVKGARIIVFDVFEDLGKSGSTTKGRDEFNKMIGFIKSGKYNLFIAYSISRVARNAADALKFIELLTDKNVAYWFIQENLSNRDSDNSLSTVMTKLILQIASVFAEFERNITRERIKAGLERARKSGIRVGRPPANVDLDLVKQLKRKGMSTSKIAKTLNVSRSVLYAHIERAIRKGKDPELEELFPTVGKGYSFEEVRNKSRLAQ